MANVRLEMTPASVKASPLRAVMMKEALAMLLVIIVPVVAVSCGRAGRVADYDTAWSPMPEGLRDTTLRVDYTFSGGGSVIPSGTGLTGTAEASVAVAPAGHPTAAPAATEISLARMSRSNGWYGRRVNMDGVPVAGNGELCLTDAATGDTLYRTSFSTLFQEWQATPEAKEVRRSFENTFLLPMPASKAVATVQLFDSHCNVSATFSHIIDPEDILIREAEPSRMASRYIWKGGDSHEAIDVVILAEGYTADEMPTFYEDARAAVESMFAHEPYASMRDRFNFLAVAAPSAESGVSVPRENFWNETPVRSHFDTFYSDRYLTTLDIFRLHDLLTGIPYEHIIILANTDTYGGGGIYNSYTLTTAHHAKFKPVVVHEFGHSFAGLADEYAYSGDEDPYYFPDVEPWEQNITTMADFASKWQDMMDAGVPGAGLIEGAGYLEHGVWRSREDCRMRTNECEDFCPVCRRAIERIIDFYTVQR